jgi:hypothetical protein
MPAGVERAIWFVALWLGGVGSVVLVGLAVRWFLAP